LMPGPVARPVRRRTICGCPVRRNLTVRPVDPGRRAHLRQPEDEAGDAAGVAGEAHLTAVLLGQAPGGGEAQAPAPPRAAAGVERVEHVLLHGRRWAGAVVFNNDLDTLVAERLGADAGPTFGGSGFDGVTQEICEDQPDLSRIGK